VNIAPKTVLRRKGLPENLRNGGRRDWFATRRRVYCSGYCLCSQTLLKLQRPLL